MRLDEWSGVVQSVGSIKRYGWFVVIPDGGALEQCDALLSRVPLTTDDRPIAVFRVLESPKRAALMTCNLDSSASGRSIDVISAVPPATPDHPPIKLEEGGFALLDSSYKVVYGSIDMNDARRIRSVEEFLLKH